MLDQRLLLQYDPAAIPPCLPLALIHRQASLIGKRISGEEGRCPCCHQIHQKNNLSICFQQSEIGFLGVGTPLYFIVSKYLLLALVISCILSGGLTTIYQTWQCKQECLWLLGMAVVDLRPVDQQMRSWEWLNIITCLIMLGTVLFLAPRIKQQVRKLNDSNYSIKRFTLLIQNLPELTQKQLHFKIQRKLGLNNIQHIEMCFDVQRNSFLEQRLQNLLVQRAALKTRSDSSQSLVQIQEDIRLVQKQIQSQAKEKPRFLGTAFVVVSNDQDVNYIIQAHGFSAFRTFLHTLFGTFSKYLTLGNKPIYISRAPGPKDVIWQNLQINMNRTVLTFLLNIILICGFLYFEFVLQTYLLAKIYQNRRQNHSDVQAWALSNFISLVFSLVVGLFNYGIRLLVILISRLQKYVSHSHAQTAFMNVYLLFSFINTAYAVYVADSSLGSQHQHLLLWDITLICLVNAFSDPLYKLIDPSFFYSLVRRLLAYINFKDYPQLTLNRIFEGVSFPLGDNYQYVARCMLVTVWFSSAVPFNLVFTVLAMSLNYIIDRIILVKFAKTPPGYNQFMCQSVIGWLYLMPVIYVLGAIQFRERISQSQNIWEAMYKLISYSVTSAGMLLVFLVYWIFWTKEQPESSERPSFLYCKGLWRSDYRAVNPAYRYFKCLGK